MSFLHPVRLAFAGTFQADVSTVNNDVRHFDNDGFQARFQDYPETLPNGTTYNGWWNPNGTGAFRLIDCQVTGVWYADGSSTDNPAEDPVVGMWIGGSSGQTAGKLVDLDPQWQMASAPWGLRVRLTDGETDLFDSVYRSAAFRDLWFSRLVGQSQDGAASSTFQSVLEQVSWAEGAAERSRFAAELLGASLPDQLSIRLATFGYNGKADSPRYTLGHVVGVIGPSLEGEPESFVAGRRFVVAESPDNDHTWAGITYFSGRVHESGDSSTLLLDLSNALQTTTGDGASRDIGQLTVGALKDPSLGEGAALTPDNFQVLAMIPYLDSGWLQATGGVFSTPLRPNEAELVAGTPLALAAPSSPHSPTTVQVAIREIQQGQYVCAEPAVHRLDPGDTSSFTVYAFRYGLPLVGQQVQISQLGKISGTGGGDPSDVAPPQSPIPDIGVPEDALTVSALASTTDDQGRIQVSLTASEQGPGTPRVYLDGQVYLVQYALPGEPAYARGQFEYVIVHERDAVKVKDSPTWDDVAPIFAQYGDLYPIMSKGLFDFSTAESVLQHRGPLLLAFSRDITDPNHMPVTRDLSGAKRDLLLRWLQTAPDPVAEAAPDDEGLTARQRATWGRTAHGVTAVPSAGEDAPVDSKSLFAAGFKQALDERQS